DGCEAGYDSECRGYSLVFRVSFALVSFFAAHAVSIAMHPPTYDKFWPFKYMAFSVILLAFYFSPASVFDTDGYGWFARVAGAVFLVMQQVILLDIAYTWNEKWVRYGEEDDEDEPFNKWTLSLLGVSAALLACSLTAIGLLFWQFAGDGCTDNNVIISFTLIFAVFSTLAQLFFASQGSLLTSAVMTTYVTFICFSAVSLNPDSACNPVLSTSSSGVAVRAIGTVLTILSLSWTTYSAADSFTSVSPTRQDTPLLNDEFLDTDDTQRRAASENAQAFIELTIVFILISAYFAMVLTNWATFQEHSDSPDPRAGRAAMWMQVAGQWVAFLLYNWSMFAPALFPNRDF
ncbi:unnamed protein product, partial [Ectocarpus fasciculatus]